MRSARTAEMSSQSAGVQAQVRDLMLLKESDSSLMNENPWTVQQVMIPGLSLKVGMHGRKIRERTVSAANVKKFHAGPEQSRHSFPKRVRTVSVGG